MNVTDVICQVDHFPSFTVDILLDDATDGVLHKEGHSVKILVTINKGYSRAQVSSLYKGLVAELYLEQILQYSSSTCFSIFREELEGNILKITTLFSVIHAHHS